MAGTVNTGWPAVWGKGRHKKLSAQSTELPGARLPGLGKGTGFRVSPDLRCGSEVASCLLHVLCVIYPLMIGAVSGGRAAVVQPPQTGGGTWLLPQPQGALLGSLLMFAVGQTQQREFC